jgi:hypothetical protein
MDTFKQLGLQAPTEPTCKDAGAYSQLPWDLLKIPESSLRAVRGSPTCFGAAFFINVGLSVGAAAPLRKGMRLAGTTKR